MRRVLALLLGSALLVSWGAAPRLHVHGYTGHGHPDHHHGPAVHEHHAAASHVPDGVARWEGCDPGRHSIPVTVFSTVTSSSSQGAAELVTPGTVAPTLCSLRFVSLDDPRAHGPPVRTPSVPRAPPSTHLA